MVWYDPYVAITSDEKWKSLMREVYNFAYENGEDPSTLNAAMLVDDNLKKLVIASNGFPKGAKEVVGWNKRPTKYAISNHAERAVICKAAREGVKTERLTMICPWAACFNCSNAIIYSGIKTLVLHKQMFDKTPEDWIPEIISCLRLLKRNNIELIMYNGKIGQCKGFMRQEVWSP